MMKINFKFPYMRMRTLFLGIGILCMVFGVFAEQRQVNPASTELAFVKPANEMDVFVNVQLKDAKVKELLEAIEGESGFKFVYDKSLLGYDASFTVEEERVPLYDLLQRVSSESDLRFKQVNENIHVRLLEAPQNQEAPSLMDVVITGTVVDQNGDPIPGVTVSVPGEGIGTATDVDGRYSLTVPEGTTLFFSFVGFETQSIAIGGRNVIDVVLIEDLASLEEVVVVGYGTQKRVNVIGSVTAIGSEELTVAPVANVSSALAGRLPGAIVQQPSGEPGAAASILIRGNSTLGNNAPLIVVDGIPERDLNSLQASEIESVTILKDASAAIYGSRAANGVILVTTKRGTKGTPTVNYSFFSGWNTPTMLPEMADAATYAQLMREVDAYRDVPEENMQFSEEDIAKYASGDYPWTHPDTDWQKAALKKFAYTNNHNLSIGGGSDNLVYRVSFGKMHDGGLYKSNAISYDRYNLSANSDITLNKHLKVGLDVIMSQENRMSPSRGTENIFGSIIRNKPTMFATYPNGLPGPDIEYGDQPVLTTTFDPGFNDDKHYKVNSKISATFFVPNVEGLSISSYYAYDMAFRVQKLMEKPMTMYQMNTAEYLAAGNTGVEDGSAFLTPALRGTVAEPRLTDRYDDIKRSTFNLKADYIRDFNEVHNVSAFVAVESMDYLDKGISGFRRYFMSDKLPYLFAGGDAEKDNSAWVGLDSRLNYFGRVSYSYDEKYLFQFAFRRDGSIRFSEENGRWGNFPSVLLGWNISNEGFWQENLNFIQFFKLRTSWGKMGNDAVPPFQYLTNYGFANGWVVGNGTYALGLQQVGSPNPFITWEVANVFNLGFETNFLNDKVSLEFDYFYERRDNILVRRNASVPNFTGITLPDENFGVVDNSGFEVVLGYNSRKGDYSWGINGNLAFTRNKIIEFDEPAVSVPWQRLTGNPQGSTLLYKHIGIFRDEEHVQSYPSVPGAKPGDIIIEDVDENGVIDSDDRILWTKTATPEITYGLSFNFGYKGFSIQGLVQGAGNSMRRMYTDDRQGTAGNYFNYDAVGRWTPDNIDAKKPRIFERYEEYWRDAYRTNYSYHNSAYARLKNLEISYTIPDKIQQSVWLKNAQIFASGQNLLLLYSGNGIMDPEVGQDNYYPLMKVYAVGVRVSL